MKPLTEGLRLNPEADAEALAHAGVLIPLAPQSLTKAEAQPVTTSNPVTARQTVPAQAGLHTVPTSAPVPGITPAPRQLQGLADVAFPPQPATAVAGTQVAPFPYPPPTAPSPYPPPTAGLVSPRGETAAAHHEERVLARSGATASAGTRMEDNPCSTYADQHHPAGNEVAGLCAVRPGCISSKQTQRGFADTAVASGTALELPSAMAAPAQKETGVGETNDAEIGGTFDAGIGGTSGEDRQAKRQKVAVPEADLECGRSAFNPDRTAERDHNESVGVVEGQDEKPLDNTVQGADDSAMRLSPSLTTKDGSPSMAAHIRLGMPPSRVKVPMRQLTEPNT